MNVDVTRPPADDIVLPSPTERPEADVLIYDGQCAICRSQVRMLSRWDRRVGLAFLSLHDPSVGDRYPDLSRERLMREMVLVDRKGRRHGGAAAVRQLSLRLPRLWWLAPLLFLPGSMPVWQFCYRQIATRRYLFGKIESCENGACARHD